MSDLARLSPYFEAGEDAEAEAARLAGRRVYAPNDLDRAMFGPDTFSGLLTPDRPARKIRSEEVWRQARRAWEGGETAASVARRFDVGLANVWRRRASDGWSRAAPAEAEPEPVEGWAAYAERRRAEFDEELLRERELAEGLAAMMAGETVEAAPLWHLGFVYRWRAEHLGAEVAAADRARAVERGDPWAAAFWGADGGLRPLAVLDEALVRLHRAEWRRRAGLPEGAAEAWP